VESQLNGFKLYALSYTLSNDAVFHDGVHGDDNYNDHGNADAAHDHDKHAYDACGASADGVLHAAAAVADSLQ